MKIIILVVAATLAVALARPGDQSSDDKDVAENAVFMVPEGQDAPATYEALPAIDEDGPDVYATCPWFPSACVVHCRSKGFSTGFCRGGTCTCQNF